MLILWWCKNESDFPPPIFRLQVYFSHHKPELIEKEFPKNVVHLPDVELFSKKTVCFKDKTKQTLDAVIYCTGKCFRIIIF